jgi:hypothetical protein
LFFVDADSRATRLSFFPRLFFAAVDYAACQRKPGDNIAIGKRHKNRLKTNTYINSADDGKRRLAITPVSASPAPER